MEYIQRVIDISSTLAAKSVLLLGPRRTGKSSFIRHQLEPSKIYDLLKKDVFLRLARDPSIIRTSLSPNDELIVIDEIQKLPQLMDEVHAMIEEHDVRFLLSGSSARKLKREHTSLMAGRARTHHLHPFVYPEMPHLPLDRILQWGMLPPVCQAENPTEELYDFVGDYLEQEILAEALTRNIDNYARFLKHAAINNAQLLNFDKVGCQAQVSPSTIRRYYDILVDTLVGMMVEPLKRQQKRQVVSTSKFYFFDVGVVNALCDNVHVAPGTPGYGLQLEQLIAQELWAYRDYFSRRTPINFWRTRDHLEVDFIYDERIAIEVKATSAIDKRDLRGLNALCEEQRLDRLIVVCTEPEKRRLGPIEIYPVGEFLADLWNHKIT